MAQPADEKESKLLTELRVVDLKGELEKRGLDKTGVKAVLTERLENALKEEGRDPTSYKFETNEKKLGNTRRSKFPGTGVKGEDEPEGEEIDDFQIIDNADDIGDNEPEPMDTTGEGVEEPELKVASGQEEPTEVIDAPADPHPEPAIVDDVNDVPSPEAVEPKCPFTAEDTLQMHAASQKPPNMTSSDSVSMIVHAEDENHSEMGPMETSTISTVSSEEKMEEKEEISPIENEKKSDAPEPTVVEKKEEKDSEKQESEKVEKEKKENDKSDAGKNLWVTGLSTSTRAADLKQLFSKYGHVSAAKIITSTKAPGSKCFGYVSLGSADEASKCIQHLHRTELKGKTIHVERTNKDQELPMAIKLQEKKASPRKTSATTVTKSTDKSSTETAKKGDKKDDEKTSKTEKSSSENKDKSKKDAKSANDDKSKKYHSRPSHHSYSDRSRPRIARAVDRYRRPGIRPAGPSYRQRPVYSNIRNTAARLIQRSRIAPPVRREEMRRPIPLFPVRREPERADFRDIIRRKEEEHKQKEEKLKLEKEKERLRFEREKLEREKLELQQLRMTQPAPASLLYGSSSYGSSSGRRPIEGSQYYDLGTQMAQPVVDSDHRRRHSDINERERRHEREREHRRDSGRDHRSDHRDSRRDDRDTRSDRTRTSDRRDDRYSGAGGRDRERSSHHRSSAFTQPSAPSGGYGSRSGDHRMTAGSTTRGSGGYPVAAASSRRESTTYFTPPSRTAPTAAGSQYTGGGWHTATQISPNTWSTRPAAGQTLPQLTANMWGTAVQSTGSTGYSGAATDRFDAYKYPTQGRRY